MRNFDYLSLKNKKWDSSIINEIAKIHESKGRQEFYLTQKPEELAKLVEVGKLDKKGSGKNTFYVINL